MRNDDTMTTILYWEILQFLGWLKIQGINLIEEFSELEENPDDMAFQYASSWYRQKMNKELKDNRTKFTKPPPYVDRALVEIVRNEHETE